MTKEKNKKEINLYLANPLGFCAGVERAIAIVEKALEKFGAPIYIKHETVHNKFVVETLKKKGAISSTINVVLTLVRWLELSACTVIILLVLAEKDPPGWVKFVSHVMPGANRPVFSSSAGVCIVCRRKALAGQDDPSLFRSVTE